MKRVQVQFTETQLKGLKVRAVKEGVSVAELVRQAVDAGGLSVDYADVRAGALDAVGKFRSGSGDISGRHDDYLADAYDS